MEQTIDEFRASRKLTEPDEVSPAEIAAFLDGRLSADDRLRVTAHLADDPEARREIVDAARIVATMPGRPTRIARFASIAGIAAAAVIAFVILRPADSHRIPNIQPAERRGVSEQPTVLELLTPLEGGRINPRGSFVWHGIEGASYRIVILDAGGKTVFKESTTDTVHAIPIALLKNGSGKYYWSVDASLPDGSSMTSGEREFVVGQQ